QVARDGKSHAVPRPPLLLVVARCAHDLVGALLETARRDAQPVHSPRVRLDEIAPLELHRVESDVPRDLLQVQLEGEARLWRAVTALGTARRLVGEHPAALESV